MGSHGIKDQVAIVGMGCTKFGEHWDKGTDELLLWSTDEAFKSVDLKKDDVDAFWLGTAMGSGAQTLSRPLEMRKPVTRVENYCATGSEALRNASYAVASGAYDVAMAVGVEKVKDPGYQGLASGGGPSTDGTNRTLAAAAMFAMCAPAYGKKYGVSDEQMREVLARISWKNHQNGARNERAQFRKEVSMDTICNAPLMAGSLGVFDCSGVADGSAAAIIVRAEDAEKYTDTPLYIKGLQMISGDAIGNSDPDYDYTHFPEIEQAGKDAYAQAGVTTTLTDRDGRGARLLHARRAADLRGPRLRRARHRLEGGAERHLRPRGRPAGEPRRRLEVVRSPGRRVGPADVLRELAPADGPGPARAAHQARRPRPWPRPQPRRLPGRDGQLRRDRRRRARVTGRAGRRRWRPDTRHAAYAESLAEFGRPVHLAKRRRLDPRARHRRHRGARRHGPVPHVLLRRAGRGRGRTSTGSLTVS